MPTRLTWCLMQWQRGSDPIDIPVWNGEPNTIQDFEYDVLLYRDATIEKDCGVVSPRIARKMTGRARDAIIGMTIAERSALQQPDGATFLLKFLKDRLGGAPALDVGKYLERYFFNLRRERGETMTGYIQWEQNTYSDLGRAIGRMTTANAVAPAVTAGAPLEAAPHAHVTVPDSPVLAADEVAAAAPAPAAAAEAATPAVPVAGPPVFPIGTPTRAGGADVDALGTGPPSVDVLPDGVRSWLLLRRSGLPTQSRTTLIGHLDGRYTMPRVTRRLRESFDDADLREIDQGRQARGGGFGMEAHDELVDDEPEFFDPEEDQSY